MAKVLLVNPPMFGLYAKSLIRFSVPRYYPLNLLLVASPLHSSGHNVKLLDLQWDYKWEASLKARIKSFSPDYVGITFTTPLYPYAARIAAIAKSINPCIIVVAGGAHVSSLPEETLRHSKIDVGVIGEGDFTLNEIVSTSNLKNVKGVVFKQNGSIEQTQPRLIIEDLDKTPFPLLSLINAKNYHVPSTFSRRNPVALIETSRGCVFGCSYCNKSVFGRGFRVKSPERVVADFQRLHKLGFKEVHIADDGFTTDIDRAIAICRKLISNKNKMLINCSNGIRADRLNPELCTWMRRAGVYMAGFGVESGSQRVLDSLCKGLTKQVILNAFRMCKRAGIETIAYFMLGVPGETRKEVLDTIEFAKRLDPTIAKFSIMVPLPGTPVFNSLEKQGRLLSHNWGDYGFYRQKQIFRHDNLSWEEIQGLERRAYREFYLRPRQIMRLLKRLPLFVIIPRRLRRLGFS